jgi:hypothetical protein
MYSKSNRLFQNKNSIMFRGMNFGIRHDKVQIYLTRALIWRNVNLKKTSYYRSKNLIP